jgi:dynamin 1-like protein
VANSDALRLAREVDPSGKRTMGVFTKMDLIEDPNTILKAFEGKAYELQLGYYGVIC